MSKNKPDREYYLLFLLIFILAFAFGVAIGCYVCPVGDTGDLTLKVENPNGDALDNVAVEVVNDDGTTVRTGTTNSSGEVTFTDLQNGQYDVTATLGSGNSAVSATEQVTIAGSDVSETIVISGGAGSQDPSKPTG